MLPTLGDNLRRTTQDIATVSMIFAYRLILDVHGRSRGD